MIQANELRIGNYVVFNTNNRPFQITAATILEIYQMGEQEHPFNYESIPLSEDWLVKFGFELIHNKNIHYVINDPNGYKDSHKISVFATIDEQFHIAFSDTLGGYKDYIPTTKIKYVHQLQNLFQILTGQELEVAE